MNINSTLEELQLYDYTVDFNESVNEVIKNFKNFPEIPGVILTENNQFIGIVSQKSFWQYMSRPYSLELSLKRSIYYVYQFLNLKTLVFSKDISIVEAARKILKRKEKSLAEPIVVKLNSGEYKLLDIRQLLIAQAEIHELSNLLIINLCKDLEKTNKKLKLLANLDGLTQLANQRLFDEYLQTEWNEALKSTKSLSLIVFELDYFKAYDEIYGHAKADDSLRQIAKAIKELIKEKECLAARYVEDVFAILFPGTNEAHAITIAEDIRQKILTLEIANSGSKISPYLTISLGVSTTVPVQEEAPDILFVAADRALSRSKRSGGNCVIISDSQSNSIKTNRNIF
ncbi:MAG: GGDEF domain-containing protein [Prochloraceae cyanobacterium]|nr:GGDEF domain-containing protein [Prochloraceae cyanobacterium]